MADKIHNKRKDWPHFDKFHLGSDAYAEGYNRIFGSKNETSGIQKRSKKNSEEAGREHESRGRYSRRVKPKSKRQSKSA